MTSVPSVSVLVLNQDGRDQLDACLSSLEAQEYPRDRLTIEVVATSSSEGSVELVRGRFPRVHVRTFEANRGAASAFNIAVDGATSDFVAFLSHETRVDRRWLAELISAADRHRASAVASRILNWAGDRIDSAGAIVSFTGHWWARDAGEPATADYPEAEQLFAYGSSALVARAAFLEAGGFDEDYFSGLEDVDLGWRLSLSGHRTVFAPKAVTYRHRHDVAPGVAEARRLRLYERNALATIYKNYETQTLERVLPVAVALSLARGLYRSGIDSLPLKFGAALPPFVTVEPKVSALLIALEDFCAWLPSLAARRKAIQASRRRSDAELLPLFGDPFRLHEIGGPYSDIARVLIRDFGVEEMLRPGVGRAPSPRTDGNLPPPRPEQIPLTVAAGVPKVSVVILTALGIEHLRACLASLRAQNYPADQCEVIIVDNGSPAAVTTAEIEMWYPGAKIVRNATNLGFARGNNIGAGVADGRYLFFLNDDTRVDPDCLIEMTATARRRNAAAVGACMLDWEGKKLDFALGAVNFEGRGLQLQHSVDTERLHLEEVPLLFGCGGALLVDRAVFAQTGGWDADAFAYYEDVELGWRLNLLGYQVWLSPRAIVFHKQHGTASRWPDAPRTRLYQRNSLRMLYSLLDLRSLVRVLPAALLLASDRALLLTSLSRASDTARAPRPWPVKFERLTESAKAALRMRGINRRMSMTAVLKSLGVRGAAGVVGDVGRASLRSVEHARKRYLVEQGTISGTLEEHVETISLPAAAIMSGILGFLVDLPMLTLRRRDLQDSRLLADSDLLQAFGAEWTTPSASVYPGEHRQVQRQLIEILGIASLAGHVSREEPVNSRSDVLRGR